MIEYGQERGDGGDGLWHVRVGGEYQGRACETELGARALARMIAGGRRVVRTVFAVAGKPKPPAAKRAPRARVPKSQPWPKPTDDE